MTAIKCCARTKELKINLSVGRQDACEFCVSDLHCCLNCKFYTIGAYNDCCEPQSDRVIEKNLSNFCDYFTFASGLRTKTDDASEKAESARKALEEIFKEG
jgi:hypothetical protein